MNRLLLTGMFVVLSSSALAAQQSGQQGSYQGTSNPPADDVIVTDQSPAAKPPAGHPYAAQPAPAQQANVPQASPDQAQADPAAQPEPAQVQAVQQPASVDPNRNYSAQDADAGTVAVAQDPAAMPAPPAVAMHGYAADPDGDIVHPRELRPGELAEGTTIRVKLLDRLSTALTEQGEPFHSQVAYDVLQGGQVLIPAGTEIDGTVVEVSSGHPGGTGSMRLRPEQIILADGSRYRLYADVTGTLGSKTRVVGEGTIKPESRWKRDAIEYGGAVGGGAITGAVVAGPVGALTGGLIGAGAITAHLLVSHPQASLDPGTTLMLELTGPLQMTPSNPTGN